MKTDTILRNLKRWWKPLAGIAGFAVMVVYAGGMLHDKTPPDAIDRQPGRPLPEGAEVIDLTARTIASRIDIIGSTASERMVQVSPRLNAVAEEILVKAGDRVTAGQVLVRLDDRELRERLAAVEAGLRQAEAEYHRTRQLFEKEATTQQAFTAAEAAFQSASAQADQVRVMLSYATVTSPIDGIVTERQIEAGDLAHPGRVLLTLYDPTDMRLEAAVPVRLIDRFALGQQHTVTLDFPAGQHPAVVTEIVAGIDPMSRTRTVKLKLQTEREDILPGTFGRIWVEGDEREAIVVPASAIVRVGQLEMADVVRDDRVLRRLVKTRPAGEDGLEVLSGLSAGDRVITNPTPES